MNIRIETWLQHDIRFVEVTPGDWWAVAADVADALGYSKVDSMMRKLKPNQKDAHLMSTPGGNQEMSIISENGIYRAVLRSRRKEAEVFEEWLYDVIKQLRQSSGLQAFQVFRMLDKEHQREAMGRLNASLREPGRPDFIKANVIADKAVSTKFGHPKMLKKNQMTPAMLVERQPILDDTIELMGVVDRFHLDMSVSKAIYSKHAH
ncbi:Bro-N domain-containing protein [Cohnella sp. GCM10012308]|uniref:BRO-N domain-containing protein n=1 Tax=Cohnella sp. GCM10012308 TaxID=3317329 RepID=UPI0036221AEB